MPQHSSWIPIQNIWTILHSFFEIMSRNWLISLLISWNWTCYQRKWRTLMKTQKQSSFWTTYLRHITTGKKPMHEILIDIISHNVILLLFELPIYSAMYWLFFIKRNYFLLHSWSCLCRTKILKLFLKWNFQIKNLWYYV